MSHDWYSPSYSPPDHAYTPTGDVVDDDVDYYPSDYDYSYDDWRYDDRPRGTGRKLPAPPPTSEYGYQTPTPTINGDYMAPTDGFANTPHDTAAPVNAYTDDVHRDYNDYNGYYDAVDDYYDVSDGYDRTSDMYDDRYYTSCDGEYGEGLVNGYADGYMHEREMDRHQLAYYDYSDKSYDASYQLPSQYDGTDRGTDVDQQSDRYHLPLVASTTSPAVQVGDVDRRTPHDAAVYAGDYVDRDGVYRHYDDRRCDDERYYNGSAKYVPSIPSDAGESAYDVDELAEVMSSVPARSSIDSSVAPAVRYDRFYDGKTDSFESYDRDSTAYDATAAMKDSGYQTYNHPQSVPSEPEPAYFNHVDVASWQPPAVVNGDVGRSPITVTDAQVARQSFVVGHPAENTFAPSADQRWPGSGPPVSYADGMSAAPVTADFSDVAIPTSSVDPTNIRYYFCYCQLYALLSHLYCRSVTVCFVCT